MAEVTEYIYILNEAWQQHLAPRESNAPTVVSLFAGCGGSSLGYSIAGFRELLAVEWDNNAVETFKLNFPDVPVYHGDICKLSVEECLELAGLQPGQLDVLDGSPPCQGFSTAGKRQLDDPRNGLFREYVRLLRGLQPRVFIMENVSGMVKGKMKLVFAEAMRELKASGYKVSARSMNAMYFNVPQSRQRMIFVGVREELGIVPSHPKPQSAGRYVRDAWQGLSETEQDINIGHVWHQMRTTAKAYQSLLVTPQGGKLRGFGIAKRLAWGVVASTVQTGGECLGVPSSSWLSHPSQPRGMSLREAARLGSFPDQFRFCQDYRQSAKQNGNSVPPLFMRAIAQHIRQNILDVESVKHA